MVCIWATCGCMIHCHYEPGLDRVWGFAGYQGCQWAVLGEGAASPSILISLLLPFLSCFFFHVWCALQVTQWLVGSVPHMFLIMLSCVTDRKYCSVVAGGSACLLG